MFCLWARHWYPVESATHRRRRLRANYLLTTCTDKTKSCIKSTQRVLDEVNGNAKSRIRRINISTVQ